ncbi:MAG: protein translocase subunit SecF [Rhodospirillaceae bacterium]|nr:protein translocase subunit SecF [Rhodospirillaceae bacterium]
MLRPIHLISLDPRIDFMRFHKVLFAVSLVMLVGSIVLVAVKGLNYGIDFTGGILIEAQSTEGPADLATMRSTVSNLGLGEVALQQFGGPSDVLIRVQQQEGGEQAQLRAADKVKEALGPGFQIRRTEFVGPKVGDELRWDAIKAFGLAMLGIMAYIWFRYEWQFSINAILALFHDCITTLGLFSLLGLNFDLATVAAVLTIAGYSVNDTVVIYDRIRDELRKYKKMPLKQLLNESINKTLSRTVVTSGLTLLSVVALFAVGGEALRSFSAALIWGIVVGTYSTIFVASPLLMYMNIRRETVDRAQGEKAAEGKAAPAVTRSGVAGRGGA